MQILGKRYAPAMLLAGQKILWKKTWESWCTFSKLNKPGVCLGNKQGQQYLWLHLQ